MCGQHLVKPHWLVEGTHISQATKVIKLPAVGLVRLASMNMVDA